ncbi:MAG: hypothetical protein JST80_06110 [Bdellovibrionales bacterium]|nr:hypothetical protein [Bdellovibrionales bacterium]
MRTLNTLLVIGSLTMPALAGANPPTSSSPPSGPPGGTLNSTVCPTNYQPLSGTLTAASCEQDGGSIISCTPPYGSTGNISVCVPPHEENNAPVATYTVAFPNTGLQGGISAPANIKIQSADSDIANGIQPSSVSRRIGGTTADAQFHNTVNKRLAVCLNGMGAQGDAAGTNYTTAAGQKFDCIANDTNAYYYRDFNDLWASTDAASDGGQMFALALKNAQGKPLTGFYRLNGSRCDQYSEFAANTSGTGSTGSTEGTIQPGIINADGTITDQGSPIVTPGSTSGGVATALAEMRHSLPGIILPGSAAEKKECPVLIRAAFIASCPDNPLTGPKPTVQANSGGKEYKRCTSASKIRIAIRAEQIWEIAGQAKMPVFDSLVQSSQSTSVSLNRILAQKYGVDCPTNMHRSPITGTCTY